MITTLVFHAEEQEEAKLAMKATKMYAALDEIREQVRQHYKYDQDAERTFDYISEILQEILHD